MAFDDEQTNPSEREDVHAAAAVLEYNSLQPLPVVLLPLVLLCSYDPMNWKRNQLD